MFLGKSNKFFISLGQMIYWLSWPARRFVLNNSQRARVLIVVDDEVLFIKDWIGTGHWSLPGGGIHKKESPKQAVIRETMEEIGVALDKETLLPVLHKKFYYGGGIVIDYNCFTVKLSYKPIIKLRYPEIYEAKWFTIDQVSNLNLSNVLQELTAINFNKVSNI